MPVRWAHAAGVAASAAPDTDVDGQDNHAGSPCTVRVHGGGQASSALRFGSSARPLCTCSAWVKRSQRPTLVCHTSWRLCALEQVGPIQEQMEFTGTSTRSVAALVPCRAAALLNGLLGRSRPPHPQPQNPPILAPDRCPGLRHRRRSVRFDSSWGPGFGPSTTTSSRRFRCALALLHTRHARPPWSH